MASVLEQLQVKYKTREVDKGTDETRTTIVWQGSRHLCEQYMFFHKPGEINSTYGTLDSVKMTQDDGPFWNVTTVWKIDTSKEEPTAANNQFGPKYSTLSMNVMSMPLEAHKLYKMKWNYNFYATRKYSEMNATYQTAATNITANAGKYGQVINDYVTNTIYQYSYAAMKNATADTVFFCWGKSPSDCPSIDHNLNSNFAGEWVMIGMMTKPGVESFSYPTYTLTEKGKNLTKDKAGWNLAKKAGHISAPQYGDFDITDNLGGNWLCERRRDILRWQVLDNDKVIHA